MIARTAVQEVLPWPLYSLTGGSSRGPLAWVLLDLYVKLRMSCAFLRRVSSPACMRLGDRCRPSERAALASVAYMLLLGY